MEVLGTERSGDAVKVTNDQFFLAVICFRKIKYSLWWKAYSLCRPSHRGPTTKKFTILEISTCVSCRETVYAPHEAYYP